MDKEDWKRLDHLFGMLPKDQTWKEHHEQNELFTKTRQAEEHPEDWDSPCLCQLCISYAD